ncbi:NAD(P)-dependent oxidoreductase [Xylocopilactobacillus apis]|uniref:3-hydroxyisobutyrate dehydrogenase n=1 Tax=Xylocopilactobacillus apis TaxID=2932183 RepID=A0AAU9CRS1_9LACO|nr:NAD(P)-dependent oxidoreductase [Xylocopilactobacillus apis]BDR56639.1 3-hydroxyisobutyrate dehydrogenase [Xylocopilactobacillus apis]
MKIGFIGTGVMGTGMINNLLKAGYSVLVYNRTKSHAQSVLQNGAQWLENPREVAQNSDFVITIVGFPKDVREVYFGENGIFEGIHSNLMLIDMTTSSPNLAKEIAKKAQNEGISALDAPVSGGDIGAKNGTLTIMVGGEKSDFERALPVLKAMGKSVRLFGDSGQGQNAKMVNQIMVAGTMTGMVEALFYAKSANLDLSNIVEMISGGAAQNWSMDNYGPRILKGDYKPGFAAKHFLKDLRIAIDSANEMGLNLPGTKTAEDLYQKMVNEYQLGDLGTQGLIKIY